MQGVKRGEVTLREMLLAGRKGAGMTQVDAMIAVGLRQPISVSRYERGMAIRDPPTFSRMIAAYGLDADQAWAAWGVAYAERARAGLEALED
jgi:hypothetical protein